MHTRTESNCLIKSTSGIRLRSIAGRIIAPLVIIFAISGCSTLNSKQKIEYDQMKQDSALIEEKNPAAGAALGILPGFGAFYARQPIVGVVDLLLWPVSILWDPIVGYEGSKKINYEITTAYLKREKEKELAELENRKLLEEITKEEYSMFPKTKAIDWLSVREDDDNTIGSQELACTGDKCEIL